MRLLLLFLLFPLIGMSQNKPVISMYNHTKTIQFLHSDSTVTEVLKTNFSYITSSTKQSMGFGVNYGGSGLKLVNVLANGLTTPAVPNARALRDTVTIWLNEE